MIVFGIYNIVVSIILIVVSIMCIKNVNEDIKEDEAFKKEYEVEWINKYIKSAKIFKILYYFVLVIAVLVILFTLFIFIINLLEVL